MKRFFLIFALLLVSCGVFADTATQDNQNQGCVNVATSTISVPATGIVDLRPYIPGNAKGVVFNIFGGSVLFGHKNDLATGTVFVGLKRDAGQEFKWESTSPTISGRLSNLYLWCCTYDTTVATLTIGIAY